MSITEHYKGVNGQDCNTVAYSERSTCAPKGSSVDISCTYRSVNGQDCNTVAYSERSTCAPKGSSVDISCTYRSVNGQDCNTVAYSERSTCAPKGSSVDISCTYRSYENNLESGPDYINVSDLNMVSAEQTEEPGAGGPGLKVGVSSHKQQEIYRHG
ncbi:hypothetical protein F7725_006117 [Dissostichus mawsoni]|uniref:Uncharacterized protein n=1 Tax=Dissostichus mawsoni TaxID=36200 RepID=A0A7J5YT56_DISMA|nr:hypothetical protein F7725_006117 [Dissostichus mawsoni]